MYIDLLQIQRFSFLKFLQNGINQVFDNVNPIIIANRKYVFFSKYYLLKIPSQIDFLSVNNEFQPAPLTKGQAPPVVSLQAKQWGGTQEITPPYLLRRSLPLRRGARGTLYGGPKNPDYRAKQKKQAVLSDRVEPNKKSCRPSKVVNQPYNSLRNHSLFNVLSSNQRFIMPSQIKYDIFLNDSFDFSMSNVKSAQWLRMSRTQILQNGNDLKSIMRRHNKIDWFKHYSISIKGFNSFFCLGILGWRDPKSSGFHEGSIPHFGHSCLLDKQKCAFACHFTPNLFFRIEDKTGKARGWDPNKITNRIINKEISKATWLTSKTIWKSGSACRSTTISQAAPGFLLMRENKMCKAMGWNPTNTRSKKIMPRSSINNTTYNRFSQLNNVSLLEANSTNQWPKEDQWSILKKTVNRSSTNLTKTSHLTYSSEFYIPVQIIDQISKKMYLRWLLLADLPIQTKRGHFIINGYPKTVIHQIVRSPGIRFKNEDNQILADIISMRGAWMGIQIVYEKNVKAATFALSNQNKITNKPTFQRNASNLDKKISSIKENKKHLFSMNQENINSNPPGNFFSPAPSVVSLQAKRWGGTQPTKYQYQASFLQDAMRVESKIDHLPVPRLNLLNRKHENKALAKLKYWPGTFFYPQLIDYQQNYSFSGSACRFTPSILSLMFIKEGRGRLFGIPKDGCSAMGWNPTRFHHRNKENTNTITNYDDKSVSLPIMKSNLDNKPLKILGFTPSLSTPTGSVPVKLRSVYSTHRLRLSFQSKHPELININSGRGRVFGIPKTRVLSNEVEPNTEYFELKDRRGLTPKLFKLSLNSIKESEKMNSALFINFFISSSRNDKTDKKKIKLSGFAFLDYLFDHRYFTYNNYVPSWQRSSFFPASTLKRSFNTNLKSQAPPVVSLQFPFVPKGKKYAKRWGGTQAFLSFKRPLNDYLTYNEQKTTHPYLTTSSWSLYLQENPKNIKDRENYPPYFTTNDTLLKTLTWRWLKRTKQIHFSKIWPFAIQGSTFSVSQKSEENASVFCPNRNTDAFKIDPLSGSSCRFTPSSAMGWNPTGISLFESHSNNNQNNDVKNFIIENTINDNKNRKVSMMTHKDGSLWITTSVNTNGTPHIGLETSSNMYEKYLNVISNSNVIENNSSLRTLKSESINENPFLRQKNKRVHVLGSTPSRRLEWNNRRSLNILKHRGLMSKPWESTGLDYSNSNNLEEVKPFQCSSVYAELDKEEDSTVENNRLLASLVSILNTTNFRDVLFERFMNAKSYDIGLMGRKRLNKKLRLNVPLQCTTLTPLDFLAIFYKLFSLYNNFSLIQNFFPTEGRTSLKIPFLGRSFALNPKVNPWESSNYEMYRSSGSIALNQLMSINLKGATLPLASPGVGNVFRPRNSLLLDTTLKQTGSLDHLNQRHIRTSGEFLFLQFWRAILRFYQVLSQLSSRSNFIKSSYTAAGKTGRNFFSLSSISLFPSMSLTPMVSSDLPSFAPTETGIKRSSEPESSVSDKTEYILPLSDNQTHIFKAYGYFNAINSKDDGFNFNSYQYQCFQNTMSGEFVVNSNRTNPFPNKTTGSYPNNFRRETLNIVINRNDINSILPYTPYFQASSVNSLQPKTLSDGNCLNTGTQKTLSTCAQFQNFTLKQNQRDSTYAQYIKINPQAPALNKINNHQNSNTQSTLKSLFIAEPYLPSFGTKKTRIKQQAIFPTRTLGDPLLSWSFPNKKSSIFVDQPAIRFGLHPLASRGVKRQAKPRRVLYNKTRRAMPPRHECRGGAWPNIKRMAATRGDYHKHEMLIKKEAFSASLFLKDFKNNNASVFPAPPVVSLQASFFDEHQRRTRPSFLYTKKTGAQRWGGTQHFLNKDAYRRNLIDFKIFLNKKHLGSQAPPVVSLQPKRWGGTQKFWPNQASPRAASFSSKHQAEPWAETQIKKPNTFESIKSLKESQTFQVSPLVFQKRPKNLVLTLDKSSPFNEKIDTIIKKLLYSTKELRVFDAKERMRNLETKLFNGVFKEFFNLDPLSQDLDETNGLSEIIHKRRISALGKGGVTSKNAPLSIRSIHPSFYGRLCPIDSPEGDRVGLINSLTNYARINSIGYIATPFYRTRHHDNLQLYVNLKHEKFLAHSPYQKSDKNADYFNDNQTFPRPSFKLFKTGRFNQELLTNQYHKDNALPRFSQWSKNKNIKINNNYNTTVIPFGKQSQGTQISLLGSQSTLQMRVCPPIAFFGKISNSYNVSRSLRLSFQDMIDDIGKTKEIIKCNQHKQSYGVSSPRVNTRFPKQMIFNIGSTNIERTYKYFMNSSSLRPSQIKSFLPALLASKSLIGNPFIYQSGQSHFQSTGIHSFQKAISPMPSFGLTKTQQRGPAYNSLIALPSNLKETIQNTPCFASTNYNLGINKDNQKISRTLELFLFYDTHYMTPPITQSSTIINNAKDKNLGHVYTPFLTCYFDFISFQGYAPITAFQFFSPGVGLIPFLEHDDGTRALMGANMQRQAVPLIAAELPIVGTGLEKNVAASFVISSNNSGYLYYISGKQSKQIFSPMLPSQAPPTVSLQFFFVPKGKKYAQRWNRIPKKNGKNGLNKNSQMLIHKKHIRSSSNNEFFRDAHHWVLNTHWLPYRKSYKATTINKKPAISENSWLQKGDLLVDGTSSINGELALGRNLFSIYMPWEGYNFEDAILISDKAAQGYTTIHVEEFSVKISKNELVSSIVKPFTWVNLGDILVLKKRKLENEFIMNRLLFGMSSKPKMKSVDNNPLYDPVSSYSFYGDKPSFNFQALLGKNLQNKPDRLTINSENSKKSHFGYTISPWQNKLCYNHYNKLKKTNLTNHYQDSAKTNSPKWLLTNSKGYNQPCLLNNKHGRVRNSVSVDKTGFVHGRVLSSNVRTQDANENNGCFLQNLEELNKKGGSLKDVYSFKYSPFFMSSNNNLPSKTISLSNILNDCSQLHSPFYKIIISGETSFLTEQALITDNESNLDNFNMLDDQQSSLLRMNEKDLKLLGPQRETMGLLKKNDNFEIDTSYRTGESICGWVISVKSQSQLEQNHSKDSIETASTSMFSRKNTETSRIGKIKPESLQTGVHLYDFDNTQFGHVGTLKNSDDTSINKNLYGLSNQDYGSHNTINIESKFWPLSKHVEKSIYTGSRGKTPLKNNVLNSTKKLWNKHFTGSFKKPNNIYLKWSGSACRFTPSSAMGWNPINNSKTQLATKLSFTLPPYTHSENKPSFLHVNPYNVQRVKTTERAPLKITKNSRQRPGGDTIYIYVAVAKPLQVGDKMSGRHGNKGIISKILPFYDMPYTIDGTPIDIVLNPLGVPSRMNVGQIYESLLGLTGFYKQEYYRIPPFDENYSSQFSRNFVYWKLNELKDLHFFKSSQAAPQIYNNTTTTNNSTSLTQSSPFLNRLMSENRLCLAGPCFFKKHGHDRVLHMFKTRAIQNTDDSPVSTLFRQRLLSTNPLKTRVLKRNSWLSKLSGSACDFTPSILSLMFIKEGRGRLFGIPKDGCSAMGWNPKISSNVKFPLSTQYPDVSKTLWWYPQSSIWDLSDKYSTVNWNTSLLWCSKLKIWSPPKNFSKYQSSKMISINNVFSLESASFVQTFEQKTRPWTKPVLSTDAVKKNWFFGFAANSSKQWLSLKQVTNNRSSYNQKHRFGFHPIAEYKVKPQVKPDTLFINKNRPKVEKFGLNPYFPGKMRLLNGLTGETFYRPIIVGKSYMLKLIHLVHHKIHARATGPYALITQQPLKGKRNQGGQRMGEMEIWALYGFGSASILYEMLTIKSDDPVGRERILREIAGLKENSSLNSNFQNNENNSIFSLRESTQFWKNEEYGLGSKVNESLEKGISESFRVLVMNLRALCLDMQVFKDLP